MNKLELRPAVAAFAQEMERKLRLNDWKGGWYDLSIPDAFQRLKEEILELKDAVNIPVRSDNYGNILSEAADVANFAMMIADINDELKYE